MVLKHLLHENSVFTRVKKISPHKMFSDINKSHDFFSTFSTKFEITER